ncbi:mRNA N(3)-methylcytidine methyltransferase METTL8 [Osmerus eperlanus]|uniref:mRNA N(3)-methylcytidine methyltransferase METTL8 n=1 Tax=Osmerus eperlanus TaxID=29151 RepID=UPI002E12E596
MRGFRSLSRTSVAMFLRRLNSTRGRPPAPLGARILTNSDDVFQHNMWDHVQWTEEDKEQARQRAEENSSTRIPVEEQGKYDTEASTYWENFYERHQNKFFKDRKWLFVEFPELIPMETDRTGPEECDRGQVAPCPEPRERDRDTHTVQQHPPSANHAEIVGSQPSCCQDERPTAEAADSSPGQHASLRILEVGCGAGNSVFPIIGSIKDRGVFLYCCDFSPRAVQLVKEHPAYDQSVCHAFVHDVCDEVASFPFPPLSLDVILVVFVLSSIHPERVKGVVNRLSGFLKHGGTFLFRDYGRYDLSQLRLKKGQCLSENFYIRRDGTCVYFFTKDEVHRLFTNSGLEEIQNLEDRRLQVNRGKKVVMQRVWMQSKFRKPHPLL